MHSPRPILKQQRTALKQALPSLPLPSPSLFPFAACRAVDDLSTPHVHFPPTPGLVSGEAVTHSAANYDRSSVVVQPNQCAMPSRHARILVDDDEHVQSESPNLSPSFIPFSRSRSAEGSRSTNIVGSYFHPRAFEACEPELEQEPEPEVYPFPIAAGTSAAAANTSRALRPPPLVPDTGSSSSESDESDGSLFTPPDFPSSPLSASLGVHKGHRDPVDFFSASLALNCHLHDAHPHPASSPKDTLRDGSATMASPIPHISSQDEIAAAMAFLPHPPAQPRPASPVAQRSHHQARRPASSPSRSRTPSPTRERRDRTRRSGRTARWKETGGGGMRTSSVFALPALADDGCLGGF